MSRKVLACMLMIGLIASIAGLGTYAYFSSTRVENPGFYTAHLDLELGVAYDWETYKILDNMAPGEDRVQVFILSTSPGSIGGSFSELEISYQAPCLCVGDGTEDWAEVSIPVDIALEDITQLSFLKKVVHGYCGWDPTNYPCGWNPNIILAIDADNDGDFDGDLPGYHFGTGIGSDAFVEGECPVGLTAYDTDFAKIGALTDMKWWGADVDGVVECPYGPLSGFQTQSWGKIDPTDRVKFIKIVVGGSSSWMDECAYVKGITLNGGPQPLPDIGEVITVKVEHKVGETWCSFGSWKLKDFGVVKPILKASGGVGRVRVTLHFDEDAGNKYQGIGGDIKFTFTLWQGP